MDNKNNIEDDNEQLANLNLSGKKDPFQPNDDYFNDFTSRLQNRIENFEDIKDTAPVLTSIPKYNPFRLPAGYFDELPGIIQNRCAVPAKDNAIFEWLYLIIKPRFIFPVLTVLLIAFAGIKYSSDRSSQPLTSIADEINIDDQLQAIDETTIVDALAETSSTAAGDSENDRIVNYLIENNIDETNFNNEL